MVNFGKKIHVFEKISQRNLFFAAYLCSGSIRAAVARAALRIVSGSGYEFFVVGLA
jgi:hypothetical protein